MKQRKMPLYVFLILGTVIVVFVPIVLINTVSYYYDHYVREPHPLNDPVEWVEENIVATNMEQWSRQEWQEHIGRIAQREHVQLLLLSPDNSILFSNMNELADPVWMSDDPLEGFFYEWNTGSTGNVYQLDSTPVSYHRLYDDDQHVGSLFITQESRTVGVDEHFLQKYGIHLYIGAVIFVALIFLLSIRHHILRPLFALSKASSRIANEDYAISIPYSHIKEMDSVSQAFQSMATNLKRLNKERSTIEEERRFFVFSIVHDLRTPIFSLRGYLEGLKTGIASTAEKREKYLQSSIDKADRLDELVSLLSDYSQVEQAVSLQHAESVNVPDLVQSVKEELSFQLSEKGVKLDIVGTVQSAIKGDPLLLRRAFENIIANGIRYSPVNGVITVRMSEQNRQAVVSIADQGPGLQEAEFEKIFKPLYRGEPSRNESSGGIGLGLTISQVIIQRHGGTVTAANGEHGGAVFKVCLPLVEKRA